MVRRHARRAVSALRGWPWADIGKIGGVLLALAGDHKLRDIKDASEADRTGARIVADSLASARVIAHLRAVEDTLRRDVRALKRHAHLTAAELAQYQVVGPPEPPPKRGGITGFLSRFFGSGG